MSTFNGKKLINQGNKCPICFYPPLLNEYEKFVPANTRYYNNKLLPYYIVSNMGRVYNIYNERFLSQVMSDTGIKGLKGRNPRIYVNLQFVDDKGKSYMRKISVHRLMMQSFNYIPGCENLEVDHVDGVYYHNFLSNLEWVTSEENLRRARKLGLVNDINGTAHYMCKCTEDQINLVCQLLSERRYTKKEIASISGVTEAIVNNVASRNSWIHISKFYNF